jgi:Fic family protein
LPIGAQLIMLSGFEILPIDTLDEYLRQFGPETENRFVQLQDSELSATDFSFYTSVSAVFSSKIEGEDIELDSFIKHKKWGASFLPDHTQKIDDLYEAYQYAQNSVLSESNITAAHGLLTRNILHPSRQGKTRNVNMYVTTSDGRIEYVACPPAKVDAELSKLYADLHLLMNTELSFSEIFYFASLIHLVFVKIHPFEDGNGRCARLLEKWFLAEKLDAKAWFVQSEKYYYEQHQTYYKNIRMLGLEYEELDYGKALPFLRMLPKAIA